MQPRSVPRHHKQSDAAHQNNKLTLRAAVSRHLHIRYASVVVFARMHGCFRTFLSFWRIFVLRKHQWRVMGWMDVVAVEVEEGFGRGSAHVSRSKPDNRDSYRPLRLHGPSRPSHCLLIIDLWLRFVQDPERYMNAQGSCEDMSYASIEGRGRTARPCAPRFSSDCAYLWNASEE